MSELPREEDFGEQVAQTADEFSAQPKAVKTVEEAEKTNGDGEDKTGD